MDHTSSDHENFIKSIKDLTTGFQTIQNEFIGVQKKFDLVDSLSDELPLLKEKLEEVE